jgi:hypothetical protein
VAPISTQEHPKTILSTLISTLEVRQSIIGSVGEVRDAVFPSVDPSGCFAVMCARPPTML